MRLLFGLIRFGFLSGNGILAFKYRLFCIRLKRGLSFHLKLSFHLELGFRLNLGFGHLTWIMALTKDNHLYVWDQTVRSEPLR